MSASVEGWLASAGTVVALLGGIVSIVAAVGHADFPVGVRRTAHAVVGAGVCILAVALIVYLARDTDDAAVVTSPTSVLARSGVQCPARGVFEAARAAADTFEFDRLPEDGSEVILQVVREPTRPDAEGNYKNYVVQICREFDGDLFYVSWQTEEPLKGVVAPADVDGATYSATHVYNAPVTYTVDVDGGAASVEPPLTYQLLLDTHPACAQPDLTDAAWTRLIDMPCSADVVLEFTP